MKLRTLVAAAVLVATPAFFATHAIADDAVPQIFTAEDNNLALGGYDAVSYFADGPVEGSADYATTYKGASFQFASQENLDTFLGDPDKFAPAYGGHCAWGAANAAAYPGDPKVWAIVDDRLYLNYNTEVQEGWNEDRAGFIETADAAWPGVLNPKPAAAQGS
ncbi:MAG: YHS domain-containing (seleno)protein [Pseudomonadota bacterium]